MGLDIYGEVSKKHYHASYSGLHMIRYMALISCGFPTRLGDESGMAVFPTCYVLPQGLKASDINEIISGVQGATFLYPNLMLHSDCEGTYTKNGKVDITGDNAWMTGNSIELLKELECLKESSEDRFRTTQNWTYFIMLYDLVKDEVINGTGKLTFR